MKGSIIQVLGRNNEQSKMQYLKEHLVIASFVVKKILFDHSADWIQMVNMSGS